MTDYVKLANSLNEIKLTQEQAFYKVLGYNIRRIRERLKIDQKQMAARMKLSQSTWSRVEIGDTRLSIFQLMMFCDLLRVNPWELIPK